MKTVKHIWILCLALAALMAFSIGASAETVSYCGAQGENVRWVLEDNGDLTLSGTGAIQDYSVSPWASRVVKRVLIGEGITRIGSHAFSDCKGIVDVILPQTLASIGTEAFSGCTSLRQIMLPQSVTSIEEYAFVNCNNLKDICIQSLETWCGITFKSANSNPLYPSRFLNLNGQRIFSLTIPEGVTSIGDFAFYECREIKKVTLPKSLERIGAYAFSGCTGLTELTLPDKVSYVGLNAFRDCSCISGLTVGRIIGEKTLNELYIPTDNLKTVYITEAADAIAANAFKDCPKLFSVRIPATMRTVGKDAFFNCKCLSRVDITSVEDWCKIDFVCPYSNPLHRAPKLHLNGMEVTCLTVPEGVTKIKNYAFYNFAGMKLLYLPEGLTSIGESAFYQCSALTGVVLPDSVTTLGQEAFRKCSAMTSLTIGDGLKNLGRDVFTDCTAICTLTIGIPVETKTLDALTIPKAEIQSVIVRKPVAAITANAFKDCGKLEAVAIPETVTAIGKDAFFNCKCLGRVFINSVADWCRINFDCPYSNPLHHAPRLFVNGVEVFCLTVPEGVTQIRNYAFYNFADLKILRLPEGLTAIGESAFYQCSALTGLVLPESVTTIGQEAFRKCSAMTSLTIGDNLTKVGRDAFADCTAISMLTIGLPVETKTLDNLTITKTNIKSVIIREAVTTVAANAFKDCGKLEAVTIPETVSSIEKDAFFNCKSLGRVFISSLADWCRIDFACPYSNPLHHAPRLFLNGKEISSLTIPEEITKIKNYAFYNFAGLRTLSLPEGLTSIGESAFYQCSALTGLVLPESVTTIGQEAFRKCTSMTSLTIGDNLTTVGRNAFSDCTAISKLTIGIPIETKTLDDLTVTKTNLRTVTIRKPVAAIAANAFKDCGMLESVEIPETVRTVKKDAFFNCKCLGRVFITSLVNWCRIDFDCSYSNPLHHAPRLFVNGTEIFTLTIPAGVSQIKNYAFYNFNKMKSLRLPEGLTSIGEYAFFQCSGLTELTLPETVTKIGIYAFRGCSGLTSATVPGGVINVGQGAFSACSRLKDLYFSGTEDQWKAAATGGKDHGLAKDTTIHFADKPAVRRGDVDNDGTVTPADARIALRRSVALEDYAPGTTRYIASDVDGDNVITAADARIILRMSVGLYT